MFTTLFSLSLFTALIHSVLAQSGFWIDTPELVQCQSAQIDWASTTNPPYDLLVVSAQDMCGEALEDLGNQTSTTLTWTVNIAAGTPIILSLVDSVGNEAWSGNITVGSSNDTSCLTSTSSPAVPSTPAVTGTLLTVLPSGGTATLTATSSSPKSSASGTATPGLSATSGTLSTRPLGAVTLFSSAILAVVTFAL